MSEELRENKAFISFEKKGWWLFISTSPLLIFSINSIDTFKL